MKKYAKLLVLPVAFLAMAGVSAQDITKNAVAYTSNDAALTVGTTTKNITLTALEAGAANAEKTDEKSWATCKVTAQTTAYVAPTYCTQADVDAGNVEKVGGGYCSATTEIKVAATPGVYTCTVTGFTFGETTATEFVFKTANQSLTAISAASKNSVKVFEGATVEVSDKITLGTYTKLTVAGTLRGDVKTAGAYVPGGSYSGTITYETVGAPTITAPLALTNVAGEATITYDAVDGAMSYTIYRATSATGSYSAIKSDVTELTYTDKTLDNGKSYWYKVAAKGKNGKLSSQSAASGEVKNGVEYPETLTVKAASYNSATITAGKVKGATGYLFYRSENNDDWTLVKSQSSNVYTDKDLTPGKKYYYTVAAYVTVNSTKNYGNTFGNGDAFGASMGNETIADKALVEDTTCKSVTTKLDKPSISKIVESSTSGKLKVTVNKVTGAAGYIVFNNGVETCRTEGTTCTTAVVTIGNLNTFTVVAYKGVSPAANFTHGNIEAVGYSALSAEKTYTLKPGTPKISTSNVKLLEVGEAKYFSTAVITVTKFEVAGGEEVEYVLYRSTKKNGTYSKLDVVPEDAGDTTLRKFVVDDLKPGKTYYFKAKVKVNGTLSDASNVVSKATNMTPYTKNTDLVKKLTAVAEGNKKITLTLTDNTEGATGYSIYRATKSSGKYKLVKTILVEDVDNPAEITYINKKLTVGQKYYYKVRAFRSVDGKKVYGKYSSKVSATATLEAPTELELSDATKKTITLAWEKVSGANGYRVYNSDDELVATTTKASATIKGLDSNTEYTFYVRAYANVNGKKKLGAKSENFNASTEAAE